MTKKTEIDTKTEATPPAVIDYAADAGAGLENVDKESTSIPYLKILQLGSPQVETVDGAKPGMFINSVTEELFGEAKFIPVGFERRYNQWAPRSTGGGFKGSHPTLEIDKGAMPGLTKNDKNQLMLGPDLLKDTRNHFGLIQTKSGRWVPIVLSLVSTQIKKSKNWMTRIGDLEMTNKETGETYNPASFSHSYLLKTVPEENNLGKWHGITIDMDGPIIDGGLYQAAKELHEQVGEGSLEVVEPSEEEKF